MNTERFTGLGLLILSAGMAASAILGPLVLSVIRFRVSDGAENQIVGGEIASLVVAAPAALLAGILWLRGHRPAPLLAAGPAGYAVYTYVTFILGAEYERYDGNNEKFFPFYLALIILGGVMALRAWMALDAARLPPPSTGLRRLLAGLLIALSVLFALNWTAGIVDVLNGGPVPLEYQEQPMLFWLIRLIDFALLIPLSLAAGVGLLRRRPWAMRLGCVLLSFHTFLIGSIAGMAAAMVARDDPSASPAMLVVMLAAFAALGLLLVRLLRTGTSASPRVERRGASGQDSHPTPAA